MILYFSGTGNSKYVAEKLAKLLDEELFNIEGKNRLPMMVDDEPLGIVFPVYAWGLPKIVADYLTNKNITNKFVWTVMTCGDDMGYADVILEKIIKRKVNAAYSVQMPNCRTHTSHFLALTLIPRNSQARRSRKLKLSYRE